jgi:hypothetical protein
MQLDVSNPDTAINDRSKFLLSTTLTFSLLAIVSVYAAHYRPLLSHHSGRCSPTHFMGASRSNIHCQQDTSALCLCEVAVAADVY